jgi:nicotinamidase-related amidase
MLQAGSPGASLHPHLVVPSMALEITRHRLSPFYGTELDALLRCHGVTNVAVAGLSTSGTVLAAARDAADRDYSVAVLSGEN